MNKVVELRAEPTDEETEVITGLVHHAITEYERLRAEFGELIARGLVMAMVAESMPEWVQQLRMVCR